MFIFIYVNFFMGILDVLNSSINVWDELSDRKNLGMGRRKNRVFK